MNVSQLKKLLEGFNDETEIKICGWHENYTRGSNYTYEFSPLSEKHITPSYDVDDKLTLQLECDV